MGADGTRRLKRPYHNHIALRSLLWSNSSADTGAGKPRQSTDGRKSAAVRRHLFCTQVKEEPSQYGRQDSDTLGGGGRLRLSVREANENGSVANGGLQEDPENPFLQQNESPASPRENMSARGLRTRCALIAIATTIITIIITTTIIAVSVIHRDDEQTLPPNSTNPSLSPPGVVPPPQPCPAGWIVCNRKCYSFNDTQQDWNSCRRLSAFLQASMAIIESKEELVWAKNHADTREYWLGLQRDKSAGQLTWENGITHNNSLFEVEGVSPCAVLNKDRVHTATCELHMGCICTKKSAA